MRARGLAGFAVYTVWLRGDDIRKTHRVVVAA